jgi:hypothetical protein
MAYVHTPAPTATLGQALRRVGAVLLGAIELIATAGPKSEALRLLSRTTDRQLAARGTTRDAEVRRVLGIDSYR